MPLFHRRHLIACSLALLVAAQSQLLAATCSREDVDHYLDRGFTPEQVMGLCGSLPASTATTPNITPAATAPLPPPATTGTVEAAPVAAAASDAIPAEISQDDWFKLKNAIDADSVNLTSTHIEYRRDRCRHYGPEDQAGFRNKACVTSDTQIARQGLQVQKAQKGVFMLKDREFILTSSSIEQHILDAERITNERQREVFLREFDIRPAQIDIPLRKGFDPEEIAPILRKLAL